MTDRTAPPISAVARRLSSLIPGQYCWFWFCPSVPASDSSALLLTPLREDPLRKKLRRAIRSTRPTTPSFEGLLFAEADGRISFRTSSASAWMLGRLATWAAENAPDNPGLSRLRDASASVLDSDGRITRTFSDPDLWAALPAPMVAGTLDGTAAILGSLQEQRPFWLMRQGPGGAPSIAVPGPYDAPRTFDALVLGMLKRSPAGAAPIRGRIAPTDDGGLALTVRTEAEGWRKAIAGILDAYADDHPGYRRLQCARLRQNGETHPYLNPAHAATLERLSAGDEGYFCFSHAVGFRCARERAALEKLHATARGRMRISPAGRLQLRLRDLPEGFPALLHDFANRNPAYRRLSEVDIRARSGAENA